MSSAPPPSQPTDQDLPEEVDRALAAFWRGDTTVLDRLVREDEPATERSDELYGGLRGAQPVSELRIEHGATFAGFRVLREIGRGGMGVVYAATQEHPRRTVALKLLRSGFVSKRMLRRFEHEAHLLGRLNHPGIAKIYQAGTEKIDGVSQPYFVMELVDGIRLTDFCREHDLDLRTRMELFCKVCDAVQHAHQKGVIHRDLKPANILVVNGKSNQPKVLDFGVARATESDSNQLTTQTRVGQLVGTIPYMSPEQVAGDPREMDTRSDVYSLGVILYEQLTGKLPHDLANCSLPEAARRIQDESPARLGTIDRALRGEPEVIVHRALEKDRSRRYQSAAELAADIRRHLAGEPIDAKRDSTMYLLRKSLRRYRATAAAVALFLLSLVAFAVYASVQADREREARQLAEASAAAASQEAARADAVNAFLQEMLAAADPRRAGRQDVTVRGMLDDAAQRLDDGALHDQPDVEAEVRRTIAHTYFGLGLFNSAIPHFAWRKHYHEAGAGGDDRAMLETLCWLGQSYAEATRYEEARETFQHALDIATAAGGNDHEMTLRAMDGLGGALARIGRADEAESLHLETLESVRRKFGEEHELFLNTTFHLSGVYRDQGRLEEAEPLYLRALELSRQLHGDESFITTRVRWRLATDVYAPTDRKQEAEALLREALGHARRGLGAEHTETLTVLMQLSRILRAREKRDEAEQLLRTAIASFGEIRGAETNDTLTVVGELALLVWDDGRRSESVALLADGVAQARRAHGDEHGLLADWIEQLATMYSDVQDHVAATKFARDALAIRERLLGTHHDKVSFSLQQVAWFEAGLGNYEQSVKLFDSALQRRRTQLGELHSETLRTTITLAYALRAANRADDGVELLRDAYQRIHAARQKPDSISRWVGSYYARLLSWQGRHDAAVAIQREMLNELIERGQTETHAAAENHQKLGLALASAQRYADAANHLHRSIDLYTKSSQKDSTAAHRSKSWYAHALVALGEGEAAEPWARQAYEGLQQNLGDHRWTFATLTVLGEVILVQGRVEEAATLLRESVERCRSFNLRASDRRVLHDAESALALCEYRLDGSLEAEALLLSSYQALVDGWGAAHPLTQDALLRLIAFYDDSGNSEAATKSREILKN